ncbi:hypothetical protein BC827DRAFT_1211491 [Russula dissimulans]|nr:hypothetical protein BC827DRAFT_1211491 [Russula dissimulans]
MRFIVHSPTQRYHAGCLPVHPQLFAFHGAGCSLSEAIKCVTINPARRCLGIENREGTLRQVRTRTW